MNRPLRSCFIVCMMLLNASCLFASSLIYPAPTQTIFNPYHRVSLIQNIDFHPHKNLCCVTCSQNNAVLLYQIDSEGKAKLKQKLEGHTAKIKTPQHALFSPDGNFLLVSNWSEGNFTLFASDPKGRYPKSPKKVIDSGLSPDSYRPHGMAFSSDGNYLVVAYGASIFFERALALFRVEGFSTAAPQLVLIQLLQDEDLHQGIPKGVIFSPDETMLYITLAETNSIRAYGMDWENKQILSPSIRILESEGAQHTRPEDIAFSVDGKYCAITSSYADTVDFFAYDPESNRFLSDFPAAVLKNPEPKLSFPHGLAFSRDGKFFGLTQFGPVLFDAYGDVIRWESPRFDSFSIFKLKDAT